MVFEPASLFIVFSSNDSVINLVHVGGNLLFKPSRKASRRALFSSTMSLSFRTWAWTFMPLLLHFFTTLSILQTDGLSCGMAKTLFAAVAFRTAWILLAGVGAAFWLRRLGTKKRSAMAWMFGALLPLLSPPPFAMVSFCSTLFKFPACACACASSSVFSTSSSPLLLSSAPPSSSTYGACVKTNVCYYMYSTMAEVFRKHE